jgi:hypothetical protein
MITQALPVAALLESIVGALEIPRSYYEKAIARHRSLGEWLCRPESKVAIFQPSVVSQGSFRYGTVNRPLLATDKYDLDNVTTLVIAKTALSQKDLKQLYGAEVKEYAKAHNISDPVEERNRCWRVFYADDINFHLDTLPCIPEDWEVITAITDRGVPPELAALAVSITDKRHPQYAQITSALFSSNPRGFAAWFEQCARSWALPRIRQLVESNLYASVEDVPTYELKTPLQHSIQILKRHRDVMFRTNPTSAPISMVITNLAAHAYSGEPDLYSALTAIVEKMPLFVNPNRPRVPNPANPAEDYADKWALNRTLEQHFWTWHTQVKTDLKKLPGILAGESLFNDVRRIFGIELSDGESQRFDEHRVRRAPAVVRSAALSIPSAPRPWGSGV